MAAFSLDVQCEPIEVIDLLEDCYFADVHVGEATITEYARVVAGQLGAVTIAGHDFFRNATSSCSTSREQLMGRTAKR